MGQVSLVSGPDPRAAEQARNPQAAKETAQTAPAAGRGPRPRGCADPPGVPGLSGQTALATRAGSEGCTVCRRDASL